MFRCPKPGEPNPIDWKPKSMKPKLFNIVDAVIKILSGKK